MNENIDIDTTFVPDDSAASSSASPGSISGPAHGDEHLSGHDPKTWGTPLPETPEGASFRFFIPPDRNASGASVATCVTMLSSRSV